MTMNMNQALENLTNQIVADYERFQTAGGLRERTEIQARMLDDFINSLRVEEGRKYIKIIKDNSVWGFIVKNDEGKFRAGDILKAASWAAPARNKARGNVFTDLSWVQWTGPAYL